MDHQSLIPEKEDPFHEPQPETPRRSGALEYLLLDVRGGDPPSQFLAGKRVVGPRIFSGIFHPIWAPSADAQQIAIP